jgi:hypothetical protein
VLVIRVVDCGVLEGAEVGGPPNVRLRALDHGVQDEFLGKAGQPDRSHRAVDLCRCDLERRYLSRRHDQ